AGAGPDQCADPSGPDPADVAGHFADDGFVHLRHQRPDVLGRSRTGQRFPCRRLLVRFPGRDSLQHHFVGAVLASAARKMTQQNFSIEFFPPKTPTGVEKLRVTCARLGELGPRYFSVTFGAGGSTQHGTLDTVLDIRRAGHDAAPHLSCLGSSRDSLRTILKEYQSHGIKRIVALRGDLPSGYGAMDMSSGEFRHANELVEFIRAETGDWFHIEVAAYPEMHPQAKSPQDDIANFLRKVKA